MNITVKPRPEILVDFNVFCNALEQNAEARRRDVDKLVAEGLVEYVSGKPAYRLTAAGEALRAAREE